MILFVDSTVREDSRTRRLAERLVSRLADNDVRVLRLEDEHLRPFDARTLDRRTRAIEAGRWDSPLLAKAAVFASADQIVVAAPFWDLSFPALLKTYIEWISVIGVVFRYSDDGRPIGLCRARRLFYVSTSGGPAETDPFGFGYVEALAKSFWGIPDVRRIAATGLDIVGADVEAILRSAETRLAEDVAHAAAGVSARRLSRYERIDHPSGDGTGRRQGRQGIRGEPSRFDDFGAVRPEFA